MVFRLDVRKLRRAQSLLMAVALFLVVFSINIKDANAVPAINGNITYVTSDSPNELHTVKTGLNNPPPSVYKSDQATNLYNAQYSPDGTKIAYLEATAPTILRIYKLDGTEVNTAGGPFIGTFSWSPDGKKLLITAQNGTSYFNMYTINEDGTGLTQLTNYNHYVFNPRFSPDGTKIIFQDDSDDHIHRINADGSNNISLTGSSSDEALYPSWSPDGTKIVYVSVTSSVGSIVTMNPDGSNKTIISTDDVGHSPVYSPDGTKIAYSDTSGNIRIMNADGSQNSVYVSDNAVALSWQSLTLGPSSNNINPTVGLINGVATVDIPSLFTDPYGAGIDNSTVSVTASPGNGTTSVDPVTGIITYKPKTTASTSVFSRLANAIIPKASAATTNDAFTYRVCSQTSSSLCSSGTVTVSLLGAPATGYGSSNSNMAGMLIITAGIGLTTVGLFLLRRRNHTETTL